MVVASDGVWEFLSSEDVVEIVKGCAGDADRVSSLKKKYHSCFFAFLNYRHVELDGTNLINVDALPGMPGDLCSFV